MGELPTVSIIVPVRDEERVVGRLLDALVRLDYPPEKREIIIVEDGSVDETVGICKEYARRYSDQVRLVRRSVSNGKPSALNYALKHVRNEIVAVFDADNVPELDALMKAVRYFEDSSVASVEGRACAINCAENMLTRFISYEEAVRYKAYIGGKDVLGLFVPLTGSCYFVRRSVIDEVGGWDAECLSEDMELGVRLWSKGYSIKYAPDVRSWQENPANLSQLFRQRMRWLRGCMEVALRYGKLVKKLDKKSVDVEVTLAAPYMFAICFLGYLMVIYAFLVRNAFLMFMAQVASLFSLIPSFVFGIVLIYVTRPRKMRNLLWLPLIYAYWGLHSLITLYALIQIVLRRPRRWVKTTKKGVVTIHGFR